SILGSSGRWPAGGRPARSRRRAPYGVNCSAGWCAAASGEEVRHGGRGGGVAQLRQAPGVFDGTEQRVVVVGEGGTVLLLDAGTGRDHRDLAPAVGIARPLVPDQEERAVGAE